MIRKISVLVVAAAAAIGIAAPPTQADPGVENAEDQQFMNSLVRRGVLYNFPLQKYQGQRWCREVIDGADALDATRSLASSGDYSFDEASIISTAASVHYCLCAGSLAIGGSGFPQHMCSQFETNYTRTGSYN